MMIYYDFRHVCADRRCSIYRDGDGTREESAGLRLIKGLGNSRAAVYTLYTLLSFSSRVPPGEYRTTSRWCYRWEYISMLYIEIASLVEYQSERQGATRISLISRIRAASLLRLSSVTLSALPRLKYKSGNTGTRDPVLIMLQKIRRLS